MSDSQHSPNQKYERFSRGQRIEHMLFLLSFSTLGLTGLVQKYYFSPISQWFLAVLGGVEAVRIIHRVAAVIMLVVSIYHIINLLYRVTVLRIRWTIMPTFDDFKHLYDDVMYYLGQRKHKAYYNRYNYAEKAEYLAVVWGTVIMAFTGFMLWNPIYTTRFMPGEAIPAAKAAHGGEAVLAVVAIIIWHFYHVHLRHFNKSMFTGQLTEEEMAHEHPAELAELKAGIQDPAIPPAVLRRRQQIFFPVAAVLTVAMSFGLIAFVTIETTAIKTIPPAETAIVFSPLTPTVRPTPTRAPSPTPAAGVNANSWDGAFSAVFKNRCSTCHAVTKVGGLSLATYADAIKGGNSGPGIVPGNPDNSTIIKVQSAGGHPGQLSPEELDQLIAWIMAGAPER